jgi:dsRNA-specific ribonuclease
VQARGLGLPDYVVASRVGPPHAPEFVVQVAAGGFIGSGTAGSKRAAEQLAAQNLLRALGALAGTSPAMTMEGRAVARTHP